LVLVVQLPNNGGAPDAGLD
jgi:hypothetical protein